MAWLGAFGLFWYRFLVGDDWTIAFGVAVGLVALALLHRAGVAAWWLLPVVALGLLTISLWRGRQRA